MKLLKSTSYNSSRSPLAIIVPQVLLVAVNNTFLSQIATGWQGCKNNPYYEYNPAECLYIYIYTRESIDMLFSRKKIEKGMV